VADTQKLSVELSLNDRGFTKGIQKAQQSLQGLVKSTAGLSPAVSSASRNMSTATSSVKGVQQAAQSATSSITKLKQAGSNVTVNIKAKNNASSTISQVQSQLNGFKGKVYTATVAVKQKMTGAVGAASNKLNGALLGAGAQMAAMGGIGFGIFDAVKGYADFEEEMSAVKSISGATADEFQRLKEKAIQMGADTKFSALESAQAFKYMSMAGWKTEDMIGGIAGIMNLAAASGEDLAMTSDIVTDSLSAFGLQAKDSAMFADVLAAAATNSNTNVAMMGQTFKYAAPVAGALGFTIQDTALAVGLMANQGIKGSEAGTSLRSMMTRLVKPTQESGQAMQMLGLNILDANGKMKPFREIIKDIRTGMSKLTPESKAAVAGMLAGQEAMSGLLALVNSSDSDFDKLAGSIDNSNGAAERMAQIRMDNLKGDLEQLSGDWDSFTTKLMSGKIGGFRDIVQGIDNWFTGFTENVEKNGFTVKSVIDGITSATKEMVKQTAKMDGLPSILSTVALAALSVGAFKVGKKILGAGKGIAGMLGGKGSAGGGIEDATGDDTTIHSINVYVYGKNVYDGGGYGPGGGGKGKTSSKSGGVGTIPSKTTGGGKFGKVGRGISKGFGILGKGASKLGGLLSKVGGKAFLPLSLAMGAYDMANSDNKGKTAAGIGGSLAGGLAGAKLGAMGGAALGSIAPGVGTAVGAAVGGALGGIGGAIFGEQFGQEIFDGITNNLDGISEWFSNKWNSIVDTCTPVINTIAGLFGFAWDAISTIFGPVSDWFNSNIWEPIKSDASNMWDSITGFFSSAWESIKGIWGAVAGWFDANVWGPLKTKASEVFSGLGNALSAAQARGAQITGLTGHATGTNYFGGGWTEINERGGEIVDLPSGSRIYPHATTEKMLAKEFSGAGGGGNNYTVTGNTFVVREEADIDRIAHSLFSMFGAAETNYGGV
jgi:TP901 family phage tail tape measure protein